MIRLMAEVEKRGISKRQKCPRISDPPQYFQEKEGVEQKREKAKRTQGV
jgi:hypothetical protein